MEESGQFHAPVALYPGKEPRYPLNLRLGGVQNRFGHGAEEKNSQPLPGIKHQSSSPQSSHYTAWATATSKEDWY